MGQILKASDSVLNRRLIGPIVIGFLLGFALVGANRLWPDGSDRLALHNSSAQPVMRDPALRTPGFAVSKVRPQVQASADLNRSVML